ncbi:acetyl-CoA C-acyltransferase [Paenalcaligenes niemegkensis]|uniref:thiolase family protein n=1 Tax=Paenalcaligenes niemegkensis TaxID=2895469 RepID=UPI001EE8F901|nr:acetyl-CoA C-acyltransferase [Paenalcaligenes niemegkensis]MCQ9618304.1 acetyl-CoA C-acyltransferase [Paenalcaligenes niemegkensis]
MNNDVVLLDGLRTPFGRFKGALAPIESRTLNAALIKALIGRNPDVEHCDGVILGQVLQGGLGQNPARLAAAEGGVSLSVPAITLNNVCLAGLASVADAKRRIQCGEGELYVVGGGDSMSRGRHAAVLREGVAGLKPVNLIDTTQSDGLWCGIQDAGMGPLSDELNAKLNISRDDQDAFALQSHQRAAAAQDSGFFGDEIYLNPEVYELESDEGVRRNSSLEGLQRLKPAFSTDGSLTAGNSSQMSDGAAIGVVASAEYARRHERTPLAYVVETAQTAGPDTSLHLRPADAISAVLKKTGLSVDDIDLFEINEAFASVALASARKLSLPLDKVNVNGGAIAIGHPLGGSGFRLLLTLARALERNKKRFGIAAMCGGGGQGFAVLLERRGS